MAKAKLSQILPSVRDSQHLELSDDIANALIEMASTATMPADLPPEQRQESLAAIFAPNKARQAAEFYVSEKRHEIKLPDFRKMVNRKSKGSLAALVAELASRLDNDSTPPFAQMRSLFCTGDPTTDGFDKSSDGEDDEPVTHETDEAYDTSSDPEDEWSATYSPAVVKAALDRWLELLDGLYVHAGGGAAPGRSPNEAENKFVDLLASYWQSELKLPLSSGRGVQPGSDDHDQQGPFANFVRKAAEIIPEQYRPYSWDRAIRSNTGKKA
jgi:hypothetical protein